MNLHHLTDPYLTDPSNDNQSRRHEALRRPERARAARLPDAFRLRPRILRPLPGRERIGAWQARDALTR